MASIPSAILRCRLPYWNDVSVSSFSALGVLQHPIFATNLLLHPFAAALSECPADSAMTHSRQDLQKAALNSSLQAANSQVADHLPDFAPEGYQVLQELGHNRAGGRITYLAQEFNTERTVVVKQFQFAATHNRWAEYDAFQQEIAILKTLDHPNIPRYLDSFQTATGFCMVQEYKAASSLAASRSWTVDQIRHIAIAVLEILKHLQERIPPIIHRDLKPDNILVDDHMTVYLVDFGFARLGGGQVAVSSVVKGTLGFMPPEQLFNRELTQASDLYSLGMTLLCLLTQIPATEVGMLMNDAGKLNVRERLPHLSPEFLQWLETMAHPQVSRRYTNAEEAFHHLVQVQQLTRAPLWIDRLIAPITWGTVGLIGIGILAIALYPPLRLSLRAALEAQLQVFQQSDQSLPITAANENSDNSALSTVESTLVTAQAQVIFTSKLTQASQPTDQLDTIPTEGEWFAVVNIANIANGSYLVTCDILDEAGTVMNLNGLTRESILLAENQQLQLWCHYQWGAATYEENDRIRPYWFQLRLNGQSVIKQPLQRQL